MARVSHKRKSEGHLIRSQPAKQKTAEQPQQDSSNNQKKKKHEDDNDGNSNNQVELQQTIDQLLSQVSIPQIRSNKNQDVGQKSNKRGTVRKLGQLAPNQAIQPSPVTVSGHRLAGPRNPLPTGGDQSLVLTVSRKTPFSVYLKRALAHLRKPAAGPLVLRAMGCAVSMAFSLAMAVESHLQIASPAVLLRALSTGTVVVGDEIVPKSSNIADPELIYQTRNQASVEIKLTIKR
ncbi:uncharacterized protein PGTG_13924 [Puccinia graminis f. sp. tritici CRL 75-36-700-3]|uniref:Uncharacterized protein n=1 Tax=Puccinia graminis f. sp. tritici (strain CRL 75-36-700-3 / race SCCL) TaxID=418459 RepID=E3KTC8_PUCGT|nr:uncharacterized protein PGTG_13924 [Puccinia graminis f. sp. tritici CRL 75-36-700-3]EFP87553.1 hypothetical protein PGTG_13924 [Puccinia graminis f. sp. tritici CRL 75-36-700-3]